MAPTTAELEKSFADQHLSAQVREFEYEGSTFRYLYRKSLNKPVPLLCFVMGAPMSLNDFQFTIRDSAIHTRYDVIVPERPGYGRDPRDTAMIDIAKQADFITRLILSVKDSNQPVVLESHSYGGAIAAVVSYTLDTICKAHVMLAPVIDPDHEKIFFVSPLPIQFPLKYIIDKQMKTASHEKMNHAAELKKIASVFKQIHSPIYHYHGTKDMLAPSENIEFVTKAFDPKYLHQTIIPDEGHFMDNNMVRNKLIEIADSIDR